jgi:hypothetical protein
MLELTEPQTHACKQKVTALIRLSSVQKAEVKDLLKRGVKILVADISSPVEKPYRS